MKRKYQPSLRKTTHIEHSPRSTMHASDIEACAASSYRA